MGEMLIIVPTRSRPESLAKVVEAWDVTHAFEVAQLLFVVDQDDTRIEDYRRAYAELGSELIGIEEMPEWLPLVPKLNATALAHVDEYHRIGFAGDDHRPRSGHWADDYLNALDELGTGIVSCPDGYRPDDLPTQWAMTSDIVRSLGAMVPAPVAHLFCDDAVRDLGKAADCYRYLPDVLIEHMHPVAGKAERDAQYDRVNGREQYRGDRLAYREWRTHELAQDAQRVLTLKGETA